MKTRKTSLLLATTSAAALSVFAFGSMGSTSAYAQCVGDNGAAAGGGGWNGGATATIIDCDDGTTNGDVNGNDGDDVITTNNSKLDDVNGNDGADTITLNGPAVNDINDVSGGNNDDTITLNGAFVSNDIGGDAGDDVINLNSGKVDDVRGGDGDDTITADGANIGDDIFGNAGNDVITINADTFDDVFGGTGNDKITMNGGDVDNLIGNDGNDTINMTDGQVDVNISGNDGNDVISVTGGQIDGDVNGGTGNDVISVTGGTVGNGGNDDIIGGDGDDLILLMDAAVTDDIVGGSGNDTITVDNGSVGDNVFGGSGNDTISMLSGTVGEDIEGNDGDDIIEVLGGAVSDDVEGEEGNDVITIGGTASVGDDVEGDGGNDTINIGGDADVGGNVEGDDGNDAINISGGTIGGDVFGDDGPGLDGEDVIDISGGDIAGNVFGDSGTPFDADDRNDTIRMSGGTVGIDVLGEGGDDVIELSGGQIGGSVFGDGLELETGNDMITLNGAVVVGNILGGVGDDEIDIKSGSATLVQGNEGEDTIVMTGGSVFAITGDNFADLIDGAGDNDIIELFGGTIGLDVWGQGGEDLILLDGAVVTQNIQAGVDNDVVTLVDGTVGGAAFGGGGDDQGFVVGGFDFDNLGAGTGSFFGDDGAGDTGDDTLDFVAWTGDVNADRLQEWNTVNLTLFTEATFTGGTLETDGGGDIEVFISDSSSLLLNDSGPGGGDLTIVGNLTNEGTIDMSSADIDPDNVLTVTGDYTAASDLVIDTFLDDGKSVPDNTDLLSIGGNAGGQTDLTVNPVFGSPGGLTGTGATDGILVVEAATSDVDAFSLTNADLVAGIFRYELVNPDGQPVGQDNWYLQSDFLDQIYVYEALPTAMQTIGSALIGQRVERVGVRSAVPTTVMDADGNPVAGGLPVDTALWARAVGSSVESEGDLDSTTGANFDQTLGFIQAGGEIVVSQGTSGRLLIGALGHWGTSSLDVYDAGNAERGGADFDFYGGGLTATWYGTGGLYVDGVVQYTAYDVDISTTSRWSSQSTDGYGIAASGEVGYRIPISATAALVPQAQVVWQTIDFDDFTDPDGVTVSLNDGDSLVGRLGVAFENSAAIGSSLVTGYVEANLLHEFLGDNEISASTFAGGPIPISQDVGGTSVEVGFGGTIAVNSGVSLYGEIDYTIPFDNGVQGFQALAGVRVNLNPVAPPPPAPVIAPVAETGFIVFFDWDRADLTPEANLVLDDVVVTANQGGYASVRLDGYTDLSGSAAYNLGLSERRANSVADGLIARGVAPDEIVIRAFGEENPLVPTPDGVREPQNRRVEIFLS